MMTLDALKTFGANTVEGMARCMDDEPFYLEMVELALEDQNFDALEDAMEARDAHAAFEAAHALKGSLGNVALTPIYEAACDLTELLRGKNEVAEGGDVLLGHIMALREKALAL